MKELSTNCLKIKWRRDIYNRKQIIKEAQGVSRINLASSRILGTKIPMPCPEEQNKIAQFLRTFDKKIEVEESILQTLEELRHGLVQQMLL